MARRTGGGERETFGNAGNTPADRAVQIDKSYVNDQLALGAIRAVENQNAGPKATMKVYEPSPSGRRGP